ncbi:hypothetical protein FMUND_9696 [Fusarium mundagurra]|uniref:Uncharacterized protein n=1 Tax=Fusarium mundagurra TaxID=1567541 RepID=A0A8H5YCH3_9HYPO|nr:hypothetical protein FMUND_9696 [Fusarium mundagurra]
MDTGKRPLQAYVEDDVEGDEEGTGSDIPRRETQAKRLKHTQEPNPDRVVSPPPLQPSQPAPVPQAQPATQPSVTAIRPEQTQSHVGPRPRAPARSLRRLLPAPARPIDAGNSNPLQPCWPPLPDNDNIPQALLFYAGEIRIVVNSLCGTRIRGEEFFELIRHRDTAPSARPVWTIPEISEQKEIGIPGPTSLDTDV